MVNYILSFDRGKKFLLVGLLILVFLPINRVQAQDHLVVEGRYDNDPLTSTISFFQGIIPAKDFYNYYQNSPNTGFEQPKTCVVIPYKSPKGKLSLILLLGDKSSVGGEAGLKITGLGPTSTVTLFDDPPGEDPEDNYSLSRTTGNFRWSWSSTGADGAIITNLPTNLDLSLSFGSTKNLENLHVLSGEPGSPEKLKLDPVSSIRLRGQPVVQEIRPECNAPEFAIVGRQVTFTGAGTGNPAGEIVQYEWDFDNDGFFSYVSQKPVAHHTFHETGRHTFALRVVDKQGKKATLERTIDVVKKPLRAERSLSAEKITPGSTIEVSLKLSANVKVSGVGIEEEIPPGWRVISVIENDFVYNRSEDQWLLQSSIQSGATKRLNYKIKAPSESELEEEGVDNQIELSGEVSSASPELSCTIAGDSQLSVVRSIDPLVALAHYDFDEGKPDFSLPGRITEGQIKEAIRVWQNGGLVPGLDDIRISFQLIKEALLYHQKGAKAGTELSKPKSPALQTYRRISTKLPDDLLYVEPNSPLAVEEGAVEFTVDVFIKPGDRTIMGVGLQDELPPDWQVIPPEESGEVFHKESTNQWVLMEPILPGEKFSLRYKVRVPYYSDLGYHRISGAVSESWSGSSIAVKGDVGLKLVNRLPIKLVISRWNLETGSIDLALDNFISIGQAKHAIRLWVNDKTVPYTGGTELKFATVKEIMAYQLEGISVKERL